ncbi:MAG: FKBP-type peptidyl-prolyl cis-trans isomerase [Syntrophobacterales bacterium]|nr:FKBP-type peptidyl-prolyl cis-trans isomerase [Syntrophobacterales bacterium]
MQVITPDKYVRLAYRLRLANGAYVRGSATAPAEMEFVAGVGEVLPGLERRLYGLSPEMGEVEFVVPKEEAFGEYEPDNVQIWSTRVFPPEMELTPGQKVLPAVLPFPPEYPLVIKEVRGDQVVLDLNHPLAGQDLYYQVRVLEVREPDPEELRHKKQCHACREESMEG